MSRAMITLGKGPGSNNGNLCADSPMPQTTGILLRENDPFDSENNWRVDDLVTIFKHSVLMDVKWNVCSILTLHLSHI